MTPQQIEMLQKVGLGVLEAVAAAGEVGAPGGVLYAAMQAHGASLSQFQSIMGGLVGKAMLTQQHETYHLTREGNQFMQKLKLKFGPR